MKKGGHQAAGSLNSALCSLTLPRPSSLLETTQGCSNWRGVFLPKAAGPTCKKAEKKKDFKKTKLKVSAFLIKTSKWLLMFHSAVILFSDTSCKSYFPAPRPKWTFKDLSLPEQETLVGNLSSFFFFSFFFFFWSLKSTLCLWLSGCWRKAKSWKMCHKCFPLILGSNQNRADRIHILCILLCVRKFSSNKQYYTSQIKQKETTVVPNLISWPWSWVQQRSTLIFVCLDLFFLFFKFWLSLNYISNKYSKYRYSKNILKYSIEVNVFCYCPPPHIMKTLFLHK